MFHSFWHSYVINLRRNEDRIWNFNFSRNEFLSELINRKRKKKFLISLTFVSFQQQLQTNFYFFSIYYFVIEKDRKKFCHDK